MKINIKLMIITGLIIGTINLYANKTTNVNVNNIIVQMKTNKTKIINYDKETLVKVLNKLISARVKEIKKLINNEGKKGNLVLEDIKVNNKGMYYIYKINITDEQMNNFIKYKKVIRKRLLLAAKNIINQKNATLSDKILTYLFNEKNYKLIFEYTNGHKKLDIVITKDDLKNI